jgi:glutamine synthetase
MITTPFAARTLARRSLLSNTAVGGVRGLASLDAYDHYGKHVFTGKVADTYLKKHGASGAVLKDASWTKTHADVVAAAVLDW